jgi:hypothetical protein
VGSPFAFRSFPPLVRGNLVAAVLGLLAASGSPAQPAEPSSALSLLPTSDPGLRSDLAWLVDRGVIEMPLGTWPLPSSTLRAAWAGVDPGRLDGADADALARVQRAVARSTETARLRAGFNSARHQSLDGGDAAPGIASGSLSFYAGNEQVGGQLVFGATAQNLAPEGPRATSTVPTSRPSSPTSSSPPGRWTAGGGRAATAAQSCPTQRRRSPASSCAEPWTTRRRARC